jgi:hypothetical protein
MKIYAEILEPVTTGTRVRVCQQDGRSVASANFSNGKQGTIKAINGKIAFIELDQNNTPALAVDSGNAVGVTVKLPIVGNTGLTITYEP